jgi:hypothetical protein
MHSTGPHAAPEPSTGPHRPSGPSGGLAPLQPAALAPQRKRARSASAEAWLAAASADSSNQLGQIATALIRADTSSQLHALMLVLRDELDEAHKRSLRRQLELARKRHWLFEHRLAIALATLDASDDELARQVLIDDGIPIDRLLETAAELRQARAARRDGEAA